MSSDWLPVEIDDKETARKTFIRGVEVELFASPYDIPEFVRGGFDPEKKRFIIEFKYVGIEETKAFPLGAVTYVIGKSSNRLYGLEIDVEFLKVDGVDVKVALHDEDKEQELAACIRDQVTGAIDELLDRRPLGQIQEDNYRLAKDAVLAKQKELFAVA